MNEKQRRRYKTIDNYLNERSTIGFALMQKAARENGWSMMFTRRVMGEYKRFIFLSTVAGHVVTPSDAVDQLWHVHLLHTRWYWGEFCNGVLGKALHHEPSREHRDDKEKYKDCYCKTLVTYENWFDERPPADIWPDAHVRFGEDLAFVRVNVKRYWLIRKNIFSLSVIAGFLRARFQSVV